MPSIKGKIESIMHGRGNPPIPSVASLLMGAAHIYGAVQRLRAVCYRNRLFTSRQLPCKVISVGNITVGGTGKTPMTIYLAGEIKRAGYQVAVVSRGYKGGAEKRGGIVSDGRRLNLGPELAGDEPYMIACRLKDVPVVVGKNRFTAGMLAVEKFQTDVIVLDDGFQHLKLKRDIDLVLLDYVYPLGNTHLLPRGILREPVDSLARSSACILTRCRAGGTKASMSATASVQQLVADKPVFKTSHVSYCYTVKKGEQVSLNAAMEFSSPGDVAKLKDRKVFCFSGIVRNDDFRQTVKELGFSVSGFVEFSDHHNYTQNDLANIVHLATDSNADVLITTEKDHVRFAHKQPLVMDLVVVGVKVAFKDNQKDFREFILERLR